MPCCRVHQQVLQHATPNDTVVHFEFGGNMKDHIAEDETFLSNICSSGETIFYFSRKVNRLTTLYGKVKNHHAVAEHLRDSPKTKVFVF
jgi:hypothetical protein